MTLLLLACASSALADWRTYELKIETIEDAVLGMDQTVGITIEPTGDPADDLIPMAGVELTIAYDSDHLAFNAARKGPFMNGCGWEYFTYEELPGTVAPCGSGGPQMKLVHISIWADLTGPPHPSCITASSVGTLVEMGFSVVGQQLPGNTYLPIEFYWPDGAYPDECAANSIMYTDGQHSFIAANAYDYQGLAYDPSVACAGPDPGCDAWEFGWEYLDFRSGGIVTHLALRGDINWNSIPFEIADQIKWMYYFINGVSVFTHDPVGQIMSTDINCDGITLSVADYVMQGRIFWNIDPEWPCPGDGYGKSGAVMGSVGLFAEGRAGMTSLPVEVWVANDAAVGGMQARFEYDPAVLTPVIDPNCYYCGDGISVFHEVIGRAWDIYNTGTIRVVNPEPGAIVVRLVPGDSLTPMAAGDDMVLRIHFDVASGLPAGSTSPLTLVEMNYDYNEFSSTYGDASAPALLASDFTVTADELVYPGGSGNRGAVNVPLSFTLGNDDDLVGLTARIEYDPVGLTPHFLSGTDVRFALVGRAYGYDSLGTVSVTSTEPGEVLVDFTPPATGTMPQIDAGAGTFLRVYFDVADGVLPFPPEFEVGFVDDADQRNELMTTEGHGVFPNLTGGTFVVTTPPPPNPSCPVLFVHDGERFVQENPLLTACERTGYTDTVTDFYHVTTQAGPQDGRVRFQLREMEDEITHLEEIELITVDHAEDTRVACTADGTIHTYRSAVAPVSVIDHEGIDRLAEVRSEDDQRFRAEGPGHLIVTFAPDATSAGVIQVSSISKQICLPELKTDDSIRLAEYPTIEVKDADGRWIPLPGLPPRESEVDEFVTVAPQAADGQGQTLRISWTTGYETDVIRQLVRADEQPLVRHWNVDDYRAVSAEGNRLDFAAHEGKQVLELTKGDVFEFAFDSDVELAAGQTRDLIVRAVGKYRPDYDVLTQLLPKAPRLGDAFPNPFNPATTILYELPEAARVQLQVYDMAGRLVATLVDQRQGPGPHSVKWTGTDHAGEPVANGTYLYRLTAGRTSLAKKMVLTK